MNYNTVLVLLCGLISISLAVDNSDLQVAFLCNKPAVYLTSSGWIEDRSTDCLSDPQQILNFCKRVYPDKEITNVVESSRVATIENWCGFDASKCHQHKTHTVRPFKCLVGPFQSEALLVPEHCVFDHRHGGQCFAYMHWNETAFEACWAQGMRTDSFAMLQPCLPDADKFNGVEFVCCPVGDNQAKSGPFIVEDDSDIFEDDADVMPSAAKPVSDLDTNDIRSHHNSLTDKKGSSKGPNTDYLEADNNDVYQEYVLQARDDRKYVNEHEYFLKAKASMQKFHHDRVSKMMSDWGAARQRVSDMKVVDPKGAEKFEKEITERFQREYEALEQEGVEEKRQLSAIHQQRVQFELNNKKRDAMEKYMDVLTDPNSDVTDITKALRHYIKTEEKDRQRSLNHFRHIQQEIDLSEPNALHEQETIREQALDHMQIVDQRIQQAVDMLTRVPEYETQIRKDIADYLDTFVELDKAVDATLMSLPQENLPLAPVAPVETEQAKTFEEEANKPLDRVEKVDVSFESASSEESNEEPINILHRVELTKQEPRGFGLDVEFDDETMENERDLNALPEMMQPRVAAAQTQNADRMVHDKMSFKKSEITHSRISHESGVPANEVYGRTTTALIAVAAVAVLAVIVVGTVMLRRRSSRARQGFMAVNQNVSPEEQHVSSMQMNGYENPTYRYFEINASASNKSNASPPTKA